MIFRYVTQNKAFIEVKKIGEDLEKHQEQLLNYSFQEGVKLSILTNGITWWFYLPLHEGSWEQRKFYTMEIYDQNAEEFERVLTLQGRKRLYFTKNKNELRFPEKIKNTDIFVETNLSANGIVKMCLDVVSLFGYLKEDFTIEAHLRSLTVRQKNENIV